MSESRKTEYTPIQTLIRLVSAGARKECVNDLRVDWAAVMLLAREQNVLALVACALLHSPGLECPEELREYLMNTMRNEASVNLIRRQRIMQLLAEMKEAGIEAKVLKGYAVAGYYAHPECRGSVDTDMLIDIRKEKQAVKFFEEHNFRITPRAATSQHVICQHKKYGMVELHVALYAELIRDIWFQGMEVAELTQEPLIEVNGSEGSFITLGHTDQLIFLTLHAVKHFILEGLSLRMMLDIAQYFSNNRDNIDTKRYWELLERLHFSKIVHSIVWNMVDYGGYFVCDFPGLCAEKPEQVELLLDDLMTGGYMGSKEIEARRESGFEYNHLLIRKCKGEIPYRRYMISLKIKTGLLYIFPPLMLLKKLYPRTTRYRVLIPIIWIWQAVSYPIRRVLKGAFRRGICSKSNELSDVARKRVEMFHKFDMI